MKLLAWVDGTLLMVFDRWMQKLDTLSLILQVIFLAVKAFLSS